MKIFKFFRRNNVFYGLAGAYMLYLVYTMIKGFSEVSGNAKIATCIAIPVFAAFGILLVVGYLLGRNDEQKAAQAEAEQAEAALEEAKKAKAAQADEEKAEAAQADEEKTDAVEAGKTATLEAEQAEKSGTEAEPKSGFAKAAAALNKLEDAEEASEE